MGYFDALTGSSFKTAADGRKLFFPWGVWGRGYAIGSETDYQILRRRITIFNVVAFVLTIGTLIWLGVGTGFAVAAALIVFYLAWTQYVLRGLQPSDESLSLRESMAAQARAHNPAILWIGAVVSILFVVGGIFLLLFDNDNRLMAAGATIFFGLCAASIVYMLVLRRRS